MQLRAGKTGFALFVGVALSIGALPAAAEESAVVGARGQSKAAPSSVDASLEYGRALRRAGREPEALVELRRALSMSGGKAELVAKSQWEIARTHIARREFESALSTCRSMPKVASAMSHVCAAEAHLLWRRGSQAEAELQGYNKVSIKAASPVELQYFAMLADGRVQELASKDAEAELVYRDAIRLADTRADAHLSLGLLLLRTGRDGLSSLRRAVELDPRSPQALLELGRSLPLGSPESLTTLERAVAERPTGTDALRALAEGLVAAKRVGEANIVVGRVLKLAPNDPTSRVVAGRLALAEGRTDDAIKDGEAASKLMPNLQPARLLVADSWARKGEIDLAVEAYQAAFWLDRSDLTPLVNAAVACLKAGRVTSAKAFGTRATKDFDKSAAAWTTLGDVLVADRDVPGAKAAYGAAKKARGSDPAALDRKLAGLK